MMESNKEYWFTLEPYVYVVLKESEGLLYNTLDSACIEVKNTRVLSLLRQLREKENGGVILLTRDLCKEESVSDFICLVRKKYMGDIYDTTRSSARPVQLYPLLNFQKEVSRLEPLSDSLIGSNIMCNLYEMTLFLSIPRYPVPDFIPSVQAKMRQDKALNTNVGFSDLYAFYAPMLHQLSIIRILGDRLFKQKSFYQFIETVREVPCKKQLGVHYTEADDMDVTLFTDAMYLDVFVDFPIQDELMEKMINTLNSLSSDRVRFIFTVNSEEDLRLSAEWIEKYDLSRYTIHPGFTGDNSDFLAANLFLEKEDILSDKQSMRDIYMHMTLNSEDFGKVSVMPNGDIYANVNLDKSGNINEDAIQEIVYNELKTGRSWLRVRSQEPCSSCLYQWLCPSPSNHELALGKANLCMVVK